MNAKENEGISHWTESVFNFSRPLSESNLTTQVNLEDGSMEVVFQNISSPNKEIQQDGFCNFGFREVYAANHWWASIAVASVGSIANVLVTLVLTRRNMRNPTNLLLLGLAVADLLVSVEYVPYAILSLLDSQLRGDIMYAVYVLIHAHLSQVSHTIAIWLTVMLAVWRWILVWRPYWAQEVCTAANAQKVLLGVYLACMLLCVPSFLMYSVEGILDKEGRWRYRVGFSEMALANNERLKSVNFLLYSIAVKLAPCVILTILIPAIVRGMWAAAHKRRRLTAKPKQNDGSDKKDDATTERTTRMLLVLVALFLMTEAPQGILTVFSFIYGQLFYQYCYLQFGDFMDLLALMNSSINFALYYGMSGDFRTTFHKIFLSRRASHQRGKISE